MTSPCNGLGPLSGQVKTRATLYNGPGRCVNLRLGAFASSFWSMEGYLPMDRVPVGILPLGVHPHGPASLPSYPWIPWPENLCNLSTSHIFTMLSSTEFYLQHCSRIPLQTPLDFVQVGDFSSVTHRCYCYQSIILVPYLTVLGQSLRNVLFLFICRWSHQHTVDSIPKAIHRERSL